MYLMMVPPRCCKSPPLISNHAHHMKTLYVRINILSIKSPIMEDTTDVITDEIITKFKRRYEEGYDLMQIILGTALQVQ